MSDKIGLGDRVRDTLTGMTGVVCCIAHWLHGCVRVGIVPDEKFRDPKDVTGTVNFDEPQLEVVERGVVKPKVLVEAKKPPREPKMLGRPTGGPAREGRDFQRR